MNEKLYYDNCENNSENKLKNYDKLLCINEAECQDYTKCATQLECNDERKYKKNECIPIPEEFLVIDSQSELCTICNLNYYPLKSEMNLPYFNCYKTLEEIIIE